MLRSERSERLEARGPSVAAHPSRQALRAFLRVRRSRQAKSRLAHEPLAVAAFTMSNSAVLFVPATPCCVRVCASLQVPSLSPPPAIPQGLWRRRPSRQQQFRPPMRGGWSADRRTLSFRSRLRSATTCPGMTGTSLGAPPWRFSDADPRSRHPAVEPEPPATSRAKRNGLAVGVRTSLRCGSRRVRGTPLLAPSCRIVSRKRPLRARM